MYSIINKLIKYLISPDTWNKVYYFMRIKNSNEAKRPLNKNDVVPIVLAFLVIFLFVYLLGSLIVMIGHFLKAG